MARKPIGKKLRFEVFKRDCFTCQYCGKNPPEVVLWLDHINPVTNGGSNDIKNLVTSCRSCNIGKGSRILTDKQPSLPREIIESRIKFSDWNTSPIRKRIEPPKLDQNEVEIYGKINALYPDKIHVGGFSNLLKEAKRVFQTGHTNITSTATFYKEVNRIIDNSHAYCYLVSDMENWLDKIDCQRELNHNIQKKEG